MSPVFYVTQGFYAGVDGINAKGYNDYHFSTETPSGKREHKSRL